jgi:hypothetical protein
MVSIGVLIMPTTIEVEIDVNGNITFLEPLKIAKKSRAIITLLDDEKPNPAEVGKGENGVAVTEPEQELRHRQMNWLKMNREQYGGQYVVLDGDKLLGVAKNYPEGRIIAKNAGVPDAFISYLSKPDEMGFIGGWE